MSEDKTKVTLTRSKKDHFKLAISGKALGEFERSELRHIIEQIDNKI